MRAYLSYLWYLIRHKWFVFVECWKLGIPWLGVIHDLSKFNPVEWLSAAPRYHGTKEQQERAKGPYRHSWLHHQRHNKHHWVYWIVFTPLPGQEWLPEWGCIPMPDRYRREMLADWIGSGKTFGKPDTLAWYKSQTHKILLHPETRAWVEKQLNITERET